MSVLLCVSVVPNASCAFVAASLSLCLCSYPSFTDAVYAHWMHLYLMGNKLSKEDIAGQKEGAADAAAAAAANDAKDAKQRKTVKQH